MLAPWPTPAQTRLPREPHMGLWRNMTTAPTCRKNFYDENLCPCVLGTNGRTNKTNETTYIPQCSQMHIRQCCLLTALLHAVTKDITSKCRRRLGRHSRGWMVSAASLRLVLTWRIPDRGPWGLVSLTLFAFLVTHPSPARVATSSSAPLSWFYPQSLMQHEQML